MPFKDHFSKQSSAYGRYRPSYPSELIEYIAGRAPDHGLAVDCATGNGQAAVALAGSFERVLAIDGSFSQLGRAVAHERIVYGVALAERLPLRDASAGLVAAAQAAHWFEPEPFYQECRRVLKPGGVVALWGYGLFRVGGTIDAIIDHLYVNTLGRFWPAERRYVDDAYRSLPFLVPEESVPAFSMTAFWSREDVIGYLATWSAVQRFQDALGLDPLAGLRAELAAAWPDGAGRRIRWPVHLRLGRI
jgi:SAM-dependent methyltransferase